MSVPKEISAPINIGNQGTGNVNIGTVANGVYFPSLTNSKVLQLDGAGKLFSGTVTVSGGGTGSSGFTDNTIIVASGGVLTSAPSLSNGQLLIGSTGVLPVASTLTAGAGIGIVVGVGSITISSTVTPVTSVSAGTGINLTGTATDPMINLTVPVAISSGGTNSITALNNNRIMISSGGSIVENAALTNGQLLIGSTGLAPASATLTAGTGIGITNGAGTITIASTVTPVTSITAGTGINLTGTATDPIVNLTVPVTIANGGTNSTTALNSNRIMISSGGRIVENAALTNGQLLIGSTGVAPASSTLTAGTGINITNGAGTITVANTGAVSVGAPSTTSTANAVDITGTVLTMHHGSSSNPGIGHIQTYTANANLAIGQGTYSQFATIGLQNTAVGTSSFGFLGALVAGANNNAAFGYLALNNTTSGAANTAIGSQAGQNIGTGSDNTFVGTSAGKNMANGSGNVAVGSIAMQTPSTGSSNVFIGNLSGATVTSAAQNAALGRLSLFSLSSGTLNTALGYNSLNNMTTGTRNIGIGPSCTLAAVGDSDCIVIGNTVGNGSNTMTISSTYIAAGAGTSTLTYDAGTGQVTRLVSSLVYKNVLPTPPPVAQFAPRLFDLVPKAYTLKNDPTNTPRIGYIAEEVEQIKGPLGNSVFKSLLVYTDREDPDAPLQDREEVIPFQDPDTGEWSSQTIITQVPGKTKKVDSINYYGFVVPIIELCRLQQQEIDSLKARLTAAGIP